MPERSSVAVTMSMVSPPSCTCGGSKRDREELRRRGVGVRIVRIVRGRSSACCRRSRAGSARRRACSGHAACGRVAIGCRGGAAGFALRRSRSGFRLRRQLLRGRRRGRRRDRGDAGGEQFAEALRARGRGGDDVVAAQARTMTSTRGGAAGGKRLERHLRSRRARRRRSRRPRRR